MQFRTTSTVSRRLAWRIMLLGLLLSVLVFSVLIPWQTRSVRKHALSEASMLASTLSVLYHILDNREEMQEIAPLLLRVAHMPHVAFVDVTDSKGSVLYSSRAAHVGHHHLYSEELLEEGNFVYITQPIETSISNVANVTVGMNMTVIYEEYFHFYMELALGFLLILIFITLIIAAITRNIVGSRLAHLAEAMGNAEKGSFLVRAKVDTMDEVGAVTLAFNKLLSAITHFQVKDIEREQDLQVAHEQLSIKAELERVADELKRSNDNLNRRVNAQELLMDAAHHLGGVLNKEALLSRLVTLVHENLKWPDFVIFLTQGDLKKNPSLLLATASGAPNIELIHDLTFQFGEGITGLVAQTGMPMVIHDLSMEPRMKVKIDATDKSQIPDFLKEGSMLSVPMLYQGKVTGVMDFFSPERNAFDDDDVTLINALGALVAMAIANADLYEETLELAISDPLTGILNRRSMERIIESEITRSDRFSTPLSLLLVDVDYFKKYNDSMGHVMGDTALKEIANQLSTTVRKIDRVARFGGEEFCVILPQTTEEGARDVAEKLCAAIRKISIQGVENQPLGHLSISVGVSVYPKHLPAVLNRSPAFELIHAADEALYTAKRQGRDRVVCYHPNFQAAL